MFASKWFLNGAGPKPRTAMGVGSRAAIEYSPEKEAPYFTLDGNYGPLLNVRLMFNKSVAYRLYDAFEDDTMIRQDDNIIVETQLPDSEWLYSFLLSFGGNVTILEPENLRQAVKERILQALSII